MERLHRRVVVMALPASVPSMTSMMLQVASRAAAAVQKGNPEQAPEITEERLDELFTTVVLPLELKHQSVGYALYAEEYWKKLAHRSLRSLHLDKAEHWKNVADGLREYYNGCDTWRKQHNNSLPDRHARHQLLRALDMDMRHPRLQDQMKEPKQEERKKLLARNIDIMYSVYGSSLGIGSLSLAGQESDENYGNHYDEHEELCNFLQKFSHAVEMLDEPIREALSGMQISIDFRTRGLVVRKGANITLHKVNVSTYQLRNALQYYIKEKLNEDKQNP